MFIGVLGTSVSVPGSQKKDTEYLFRKIVIPTRILYILGAGEVVGRRETPHRASLEGRHPVPIHIRTVAGGDLDFLEAKPEGIGLRFAIKQYQGTESKEQETWLCLGTHLKPPAGRKTATRPACTAYQNPTKPVSVLLANGHPLINHGSPHSLWGGERSDSVTTLLETLSHCVGLHPERAHPTNSCASASSPVKWELSDT